MCAQMVVFNCTSPDFNGSLTVQILNSCFGETMTSDFNLEQEHYHIWCFRLDWPIGGEIIGRKGTQGAECATGVSKLLFSNDLFV